MSQPVEIKKKTLLWINKVRIPVVTPEGETEALEFNEIYNHILVPIARSDDLGISASTLRNYMERGLMKKYNANGTIKRTSRKTPVYFDLLAWRDLNLEQ